MNTLTELLSSLDKAIGYSEQVRLTEEKRIAGVNEALFIVYGMLADSKILKRSGTITLTTVGVVSPATALAVPPSDFNEGTVLYMGDSTIFDNSDEVYEVDGQIFGRYNNEDYVMFTRGESATQTEEFHFRGTTAGTYYMEYEMGAPELVNGTDTDNLPRGTRRITAKIAAGILTDNILSDSSKMQVFLYGPSGNKNAYTPDSVMGQLQKVITKRRIRKQRGRTQQIRIIGG